MKIAIVRLSALGDIIQSAIVLQFIKKFKKDIEIHWFVDERFKDILKDHPLIDKIYPLPLKNKKISKTLKILFKARKNNYNVVIDLQGLIKSAIISRILNQNNFGFSKNSLKESFAHNFYNQKLNINYNENVFVRYLALISFVFNEDFDIKNLFFKKDVFYADDIIKEKLIQEFKLKENKHNILIHVGSSAKNKIYPAKNFALLCKKINDNIANSKIFLAWGNLKEYEIAKEIQNFYPNDHIVLLRNLNLQELIALTKAVDLVIGNDSGPTHLAFALNKASITIFGATPSQRNAFVTEVNKIIDAKKKILDAKHIDKNDFCIENIDAQDIFEITKELLNEK
ncbi:lipopolysaccharide heptosyltransferase I [Campylobacter sp. TTU_617]|uniref:lipopolysaccharide heptosyltransferase I n=1 Tax=Campylobacter sp. TTU_617 TaxID=2768148 RepID=UPI001908A32D|nr:lipopolysaccharide heptosyltransferase I [Campylobacter sp. TTU_617]MBK1971567.1 lipopolysaccharide heptosyltransferase I [Campylobacter sp. TTU_617]